MALALEARAMKDDVMLGDTPKAKKRRRKLQTVETRGRLWKHSTLADLDGLIRPADLEDLFIFTMVRNPWDRMVSYYHWLRLQRFDHRAIQLAQTLEFEAFACHSEIGASFRQNTARHYVIDAQGHARADLYIRLEHFAEDVRPLEHHLGFSLDLPWTNTSERERDYRNYYSDASRAAVAQAFADDIARFGYSFDKI